MYLSVNSNVFSRFHYSRKKIAAGLNDQNRTNKNVFVISGFFNLMPLCLFLSAVISLTVGSSLSPSTMTGGTCHQLGAVAPWWDFFTPLSAETADCSCRPFPDTSARLSESLLFQGHGCRGGRWTANTLGLPL